MGGMKKLDHIETTEFAIHLSRIRISPGANAALAPKEVILAIRRHGEFDRLQLSFTSESGAKLTVASTEDFSLVIVMLEHERHLYRDLALRD